MNVIHTRSAALKTSRAGEDIAISDAVSTAMDGRDYERDDTEAALATCDNLRATVGILTEVIARSGLMTVEELRQIVGYQFEVLP